MNKYLISLDKDVQRRELFFAQPDTADFVVFSAINTMQKSGMNWQKYSIQQNLNSIMDATSQKAKLVVHKSLAVYRQIVEDQNVTENDYALVCEDDALFNSNLSPKTIALLTEKCDADIVLIGQSKIAEFNNVELEINYPTTFSFLRQTIGDVTVAYPYKSYFAGTVAYLIKKSAARAFLKQLEQEKPFLALLMISYYLKPNSRLITMWFVRLWPLKIHN